jgi:glycine cleavage system H protein
VNPDDLKYTAEHEWVRVVGEGADAVLRIGITSYAQEALGDIVFVTLPTVGSDVEAGASFGEVESTKSVSDVYAPVAGTVTAANEQLESSPELLNSDPYGDGWLVDLRPSGSLDDVLASPKLLDAAAYGELTGS